MALSKKIGKFFKNEGPPLWTKNFVKLTIGSVISFMGNATVSFILGLYVYDKTRSVFLYAIYLFLYNAAKIAVPLIAGTLLDRLSRVKAIYIMDFCSSGLFLLLWLSKLCNFFHMSLVFAASVLIGIIDSVYNNALNSLQPSLVAPENLSKSYSVQSMLSIMALIATPLATVLYHYKGENLLFFLCGLVFLSAAIVETTIKVDENQVRENSSVHPSLKTYVKDMGEGFRYIFSNRALSSIIFVILFYGLSLGASNTVWYPFFDLKFGQDSGYIFYIISTGCSISGEFMGDFLIYFAKATREHRYLLITLTGLSSILFGGIAFLLPMIPLYICQYLEGLLATVHITLRYADSQSVLPSEKIGRWNGVSTMMLNAGSLVGGLLAGSLASVVSIPLIVLGTYALYGISFVFFYTAYGKKDLKVLFQENCLLKKEL